MSGVSRDLTDAFIYTAKGKGYEAKFLCEKWVIQLECLTWSSSLRKVTFLSTEWAARTFPSETFLKPSSCRMSSSVTPKLQVSLQTHMRLVGVCQKSPLKQCLIYHYFFGSPMWHNYKLFEPNLLFNNSSLNKWTNVCTENSSYWNVSVQNVFCRTLFGPLFMILSHQWACPEIKELQKITLIDLEKQFDLFFLVKWFVDLCQ